jgi:hypothetical protein
MPAIFRQIPPPELVDSVCKAFYLRNKEDLTPFTRSTINLDLLDELLPEIEPYYVPCKAEVYLYEPLTDSRALVIFRQLLKSQGLVLLSSEKTQGKAKVTWYQIRSSATISTSTPSDQDFTVALT